MTPTDVQLIPSECNQPFDALLELRTQAGYLAFLSTDVRTAPGRKAPLLSFPPRVGPNNRGSILPYVNGELFVSASVKDPARVPQFGQLSMGAAFVVGPKLKALIETMSCPKSEFIPISLELSRRDWKEGQSTEAIGGGEIIRGVYHIWNVYNRLDIVDPVRSTSNRAETRVVRHDLPGSPELNTIYYSALGPIVLTEQPYVQSDVFLLLGWDAVFVSPRFADRVSEAGFLGTQDDGPNRRIYFSPFYLEKERFQACRAQLGKTPLTRIYGTDMVVETTDTHPFKLAQS